MHLPPINPTTLHITPTYGLIPLRNTSKQTNKQCLRENQQTKRRRLRAFVLDQKPKSREICLDPDKTLHCGNCTQEEVISAHVLQEIPA